MLDFFSDYDKLLEEETTETETETKMKEVESLRKLVGIEVRKAIDTFVEEWNKTHEPPKDEPEPPKDE